MTELEFQSLANEGYNRIPLIAEALADLETPLSLYLKLAQPERSGANSFLLESVVGGERFGRYSFIGLPARTLVRTRNGVSEVVRDGEVVETHDGDPFQFIESFQARFKVAQRPGLPRFCGGLAGYFGYDAVRYIEKKLANTAPRDDLGLPDIQLLLTEEVAVIDNLAGKLYLIIYADPSQAEAYTKAKQRLRELKQRLRTTVQPPVTSASVRTETFREFKKDDYLAAVRQAKEYIAAGELMQIHRPAPDEAVPRQSAVVVSRAAFAEPVAVHVLLQLRRFHVVGASPKSSCARKSAAKTRSSRSARLPARARAATRPSATRNSRPSCSTIRRRSPST